MLFGAYGRFRMIPGCQQFYVTVCVRLGFCSGDIISLSFAFALFMWPDGPYLRTMESRHGNQILRSILSRVISFPQ